MARKSTVETALSAEALRAFCEKLAAVPNLTLRRMQDEAKKLGITLSRSAAGRFAQGTFAKHLERLARAREYHMRIQEFKGMSEDIADAAAAQILQDISDEIASGEYNISKMAQAVATLQTSEQRRQELKAKLREYERRTAEWERKEKEREAAKAELAKAISKRGIGEDVLREIEEKIKLL